MLRQFYLSENKDRIDLHVKYNQALTHTGLILQIHLQTNQRQQPWGMNLPNRYIIQSYRFTTHRILQDFFQIVNAHLFCMKTTWFLGRIFGEIFIAWKEEDLLWVITNATTECRHVYLMTRNHFLITSPSYHNAGEPGLPRDCSPMIVGRRDLTWGLWGYKKATAEGMAAVMWAQHTLGAGSGQVASQEPRAAEVMPLLICSCE